MRFFGSSSSDSNDGSDGSSNESRVPDSPKQKKRDEIFDDYGDFVPEHLPEAGEFLERHDVLTGGEHVEFHEITRDVFEERGVYDMTFGYNLARLNLDRRYPDAGY
ncbi:MAG: hypothetical protein SXQ77_13920, partial [Halobacteria archaeon]|nr:hypothetical protein [Halobacteria archaeon]